MGGGGGEHLIKNEGCGPLRTSSDRRTYKNEWNLFASVKVAMDIRDVLGKILPRHRLKCQHIVEMCAGEEVVADHYEMGWKSVWLRKKGKKFLRHMRFKTRLDKMKYRLKNIIEWKFFDLSLFFPLSRWKCNSR